MSISGKILVRTHLSCELISGPRNVASDSWFNGMPSGFWYFIGRPIPKRLWGDRAIDRKWRYTVDVSRCRLLSVKNAYEAHATMIKWPLPPPPEDFIAAAILTAGHPDWGKLARDFDSVEVPVDPRKGEQHWHSSFDCASGCVWNAEKLRVTLLT